ncbi:TetR/AcrR family transcriptional regulator [Chryseobacterium sp. POL2]|uniref:TetR/AcrR family transcriptional regulator n=1 Tax=Chryseobacterium sp. POL2 TaxID=2713414 RepID=UPI0013E1525B|nr:TetR/AcrR family transcriptional regulator [Chryseobacterium sp. POL2]QIG89361.1 TetR/AcrR family transcriptional regulator [Chryseobacterium sp. POL2]
MSQEIKKDDTEAIIRRTAKKLFFGEGKFNATTQEIADAAGVNRTLINYYFRSRDNLFNSVFEEALKKEKEKSEFILNSEMTFKEKLSFFIEDSMNKAMQYPYLEIYIVTQMNQGCVYNKPENYDEIMLKLGDELENEIKIGNVKPISVQQFLLNLASLVSFPTCMRPLLKETMKLDDEAFDNLLKERKEIILNTLFLN